MAVKTVVTRGFGNGTFPGSIALVVPRGYVSAAPPPPPSFSGRTFAPVGRGNATTSATGRGTAVITVPGDDGTEAL